MSIVDIVKPYSVQYSKNTALIESTGNLDKNNPVKVLLVNKTPGKREAYFILNFD